MEVTKVKPYGFCAGVDRALKIANKALEENPNKNIYLLGMLVHNNYVIDTLKQKGLIVLDEKDDSLENHLESIPNKSVVIFSAHGHSSSLDEIATKKDLIVYDATCNFVKDNLLLGKQTKNLIYIGLKGHLESDAFIKENPHCMFFDLKENAFSNPIKELKEPKIITQTTVSSLEIAQAIQMIKKVYPDYILESERCSSTSLRQEQITKLDDSIDCVVILGSSSSNNSKKLKEIAKSKGYIAYLCDSLEDVKQINFSNIKKIALASGASTSRDTFEEVATYLESLN